MTTHELTRNIWFDENQGTVLVCIDRVTVSIYLEEFLSLIRELEQAQVQLESRDDITRGITEEDGVNTPVLLFTPDIEYN